MTPYLQCLEDVPEVLHICQSLHGSHTNRTAYEIKFLVLGLHMWQLSTTPRSGTARSRHIGDNLCSKSISVVFDSRKESLLINTYVFRISVAQHTIHRVLHVIVTLNQKILIGIEARSELYETVTIHGALTLQCRGTCTRCADV